MADETAKAQTAQPGGDTIFGKIARKEIEVNLLHEDDMVCISHEFWLEIQAGRRESTLAMLC